MSAWVKVSHTAKPSLNMEDDHPMDSGRCDALGFLRGTVSHITIREKTDSETGYRCQIVATLMCYTGLRCFFNVSPRMIGQFLWMADNMRWFQRTGKILIGKKVTQMHAGEYAVTKYNEIK